MKSAKRISDEEMIVTFEELTTPDLTVCETLERWENDSGLVPFIRPNQNNDDLEKHFSVTIETVRERLLHHPIYLIFVDGQLVGQMDFQIDPVHLFKKSEGTAWIGIIIGEASARGKGVGSQAMNYLEEQIKRQGLKRIELGVFEFNTRAIRLYRSLGFQEIGRIDDFTYWQGRMWQDIRMEKYLE